MKQDCSSSVSPTSGKASPRGPIVELKVVPGQSVKAGEALAIVETDKVVTEMPSPVEGVVVEMSLVKGQVVRVGEVVARIRTSAAPAPAAAHGAAPGASRRAERQPRAPASRAALRGGAGVGGRPPRHRLGRDTPVQRRGYLRCARPGRPTTAATGTRRCARLARGTEARRGRGDRPLADHRHGTRRQDTEEGPRNPLGAARRAIGRGANGQRHAGEQALHTAAGHRLRHGEEPGHSRGGRARLHDGGRAAPAAARHERERGREGRAPGVLREGSRQGAPGVPPAELDVLARQEGVPELPDAAHRRGGGHGGRPRGARGERVLDACPCRASTRKSSA